MEEFLKNFGEYIIGIPTFILGGLLSYWIYLKQKQVKNINWVIESSESIVNVKDIKPNPIDILYKGEKVESANLTIIKIYNSGNTPIVKQDFDSSLILKFDKSNKILEFDTIEKKPIDLEVVINHIESEIEILPFLFNPKDSFRLKIVASGMGTTALLTGRVVGTTITNKENSPEKKIPIIILLLAIIVFIGGCWSFANFDSIFESIPVTIAAGLYVLMLLYIDVGIIYSFFFNKDN